MSTTSPPRRHDRSTRDRVISFAKRRRDSWRIADCHSVVGGGYTTVYASVLSLVKQGELKQVSPRVFSLK